MDECVKVAAALTSDYFVVLQARKNWWSVASFKFAWTKVSLIQDS